MLLWAVPIAGDCFQTSAISGAHIHDDPFAHAADSHAN